MKEVIVFLSVLIYMMLTLSIMLSSQNIVVVVLMIGLGFYLARMHSKKNAVKDRSDEGTIIYPWN